MLSIKTWRRLDIEMKSRTPKTHAKVEELDKDMQEDGSREPRLLSGRQQWSLLFVERLSEEFVVALGISVSRGCEIFSPAVCC